MPNSGGNSGGIVSSDLTFITHAQDHHLGDRFGVLLGDDTRFLDCLAPREVTLSSCLIPAP
jgi:hypothetical protein